MLGGNGVTWSAVAFPEVTEEMREMGEVDKCVTRRMTPTATCKWKPVNVSNNMDTRIHDNSIHPAVQLGCDKVSPASPDKLPSAVGGYWRVRQGSSTEGGRVSLPHCHGAALALFLNDMAPATIVSGCGWQSGGGEQWEWGPSKECCGKSGYPAVWDVPRGRNLN